MSWKLLIHHSLFSIRKSRGFTLIELMVVISITAVLGSLGIAGFVIYGQIQALQSSANDLVTVLNIAKSRSQSQVKPTGAACSSTFGRVLKGHKVTVVTSGNNKNKYRVDAICSPATDLAVCVGNRTVNVIALKSLPAKIEFRSPTNPRVYCFPTLIGGVKTETGGPMPAGGGKIILDGFGRTKTIIIDPAGGIIIQ